MRSILLAGTLITATLGFCEEGVSMSIYADGQIEEITVTVDAEGQQLFVDVRPLLETAFSLAGARVTYQDGRQTLELVRCPLGKDCAVDVPGVYTPGTPKPVRLTLPMPETPVDVVYSNGTRLELFAP